jgi:hypothetical protein
MMRLAFRNKFPMMTITFRNKFPMMAIAFRNKLRVMSIASSDKLRRSDLSIATVEQLIRSSGGATCQLIGRSSGATDNPSDANAIDRSSLTGLLKRFPKARSRSILKAKSLSILKAKLLLICLFMLACGAGANPQARVKWSRQLSGAEAHGISVRRVLAGYDSWNPPIKHYIVSGK